MLALLRKNWWTFLLRGLVAIAFGIVAIIWPGITLSSLIIVFGAYVLVDGIFAIAYGIAERDQAQWWVNILIGLAGIIAGLWAMAFPGLTAIGLLYFIAAWWIVTGLLEIIFAVRVRKRIDNEWALIASGILSLVAGVILMLFPGSGAISLVWLIGLLSMAFGAMLVIFAFRLRNSDDDAARAYDIDPTGGLA
jgi:uncharacterized membrane protein HdeD (DUF308 family)